MATNERIEYGIKDIGHNQLAPSQGFRTMFTPGKAASLAGDMNWPKEFKVPQSGDTLSERTSGPADMTRVRVIKLGRNTVSDQTLTSVPADPLNTTQANDGRKERISGYDWAETA
jgi:hypothetical protein